MAASTTRSSARRLPPTLATAVASRDQGRGAVVASPVGRAADREACLTTRGGGPGARPAINASAPSCSLHGIRFAVGWHLTWSWAELGIQVLVAIIGIALAAALTNTVIADNRRERRRRRSSSAR